MIEGQSLPASVLRAMHRPTTLRQPGSAAPAMPASAPEAAKRAQTAEKPNSVKFVIPGAPIGKPRMTQRDKWAKRPAVLRYRAWCDEARAAAITVVKRGYEADTICIKAYLPMPKSWSVKKRATMTGQFHRQKPDLDNILKAAQDALFGDDSSIAYAVAEKRWDDGSGPRLEVELS